MPDKLVPSMTTVHQLFVVSYTAVMLVTVGMNEVYVKMHASPHVASSDVLRNTTVLAV